MDRGESMKLILQEGFKLKDTEYDVLEDLGYTFVEYNDEPVEADVFVGFLRKPYKELEDIKGLKYIQSTIAGYDMLDMENIKRKGITFCNASGTASAPIAEYVVLKTLDYYKNAQYYRDMQEKSEWAFAPYPNSGIEELSYKTILVLGTGQIGQAVAKRFKAFDVNMIGINSSGKDVEYFDETFSLDDVLEVLKKADVVVGALPLNDDTRGFYNDEFFKAMKDQSIFINVGRGPSLNEDSLQRALDLKLAHAYLDVTVKEPLDSSSWMWKHPKVSITPHLSSHSSEVEKRTRVLVFENLKRYIKNEELQNKVL